MQKWEYQITHCYVWGFVHFLNAGEILTQAMFVPLCHKIPSEAQGRSEMFSSSFVFIIKFLCVITFRKIVQSIAIALEQTIV